MSHELLERLNKTPLSDLGDVMKCLAQKCHEYRMDHKGFVPLSVFESILGISGVSCTLEVVLQLPNGSFVLKKRGGDDAGWHGEYHIPGATVTCVDTPQTALDRAMKEILGKGCKSVPIESLQSLGYGTYAAQERLTNYWTHLLHCKITSLEGLDGEWEVFSNPNDERIIWFQRPTLEFAMNQLAQTPGCPRYLDVVKLEK